MAIWRSRRLVNVPNNVHKTSSAQTVSPLIIRRHRPLISGAEDLKRTISHPFGFHHVTHTQPQQFERLDRGSQNELITEFIAIRAAQRPRSTLQGIQADDLCDINHVKQSGANVERHPRTVNTLRAPVGPPNFAASAQSSSVSPVFPKGIRSSPSIENFSRPTPWSPKSPTSPPPRTSSRNVLHSPSLPAELARKSAEGMDGLSTEDFNGYAQPALDSDVTVDGSQLRLAHAITTVDDSARPLKTSPLPTSSANVISGSTARASSKENHSVTAQICSSTNLPLRHAYSFPIAGAVSQHGHHHLSDHGQHNTETRPESLHPERAGGWEDIVDYCYDNAAEADCNFDWSQKTVYVDADHESLIAQAPDAQPVEKWTSSGDEGPQSPSNHASRPCPGAFRQPRVPARFHSHSKHNPKKSPDELEDCFSPFGRHRASSDFRGYQHWPQASSKSVQKLRIVSDEPCDDRETTSDKEPCEYADLEMPGEDYAKSERCHSGGSSTYRVVQPLLHKYSSDGSMLSSTTSTIRTYRSSNSVGSVPDLVYSLNNSRESVMAEKALPTDAANNEMPQIPQHLTLAARRQVESQAPTADRSQGRSRPQVEDAARKSSASAPTALVKLSEFTYEPVDTHKKANAAKSKTGPAPRKRSASALTPGRCLATRASYSLFPPQHSIPPLS
jgi:hypothetical protein